MDAEDSRPSFARAVVVAFGAAMLLVALLRTAWICDDAFITFRTVDNLANGHGLTWNPPYRVQAYTHPLWMLVLSGAYLVTHDLMYTTIALTIALSLAAFLVLTIGLSASPLNAMVVTVVLVLSKAFVDYSTAGLENALSHLILAVFLVVYLRYGREGPAAVLLLGVLTSFLLLSRMDLALLAAPALAASLVVCRRWKGLWALALGLAPFAAWELFSLFYYGFPFPNTAYAKLSTGIAEGQLFEQGVLYVMDSLTADPITLAVVLAGVLLPIVRRDLAALAVAAGIVLYVAYVVKIGGCFMSGRFFTAPLFCAAALVASARVSVPAATGAALVAALLGLTNPYNPWWGKNEGIDNGIADERPVYSSATALAGSSRRDRLPLSYPFIEDAERKRDGERARRARGERYVVQTMSIGMLGLHCGPSIHIVDLYGLTDPLLARLPALEDPNWRIGHFIRKVPHGYRETLATGRNRIRVKDLALYYDKIDVIVRGDLLSLGRLVEIAKMNLGFYEGLVDEERDRRFDFVRIPLAEVGEPKEAGTPWYTEGNVFLPLEGVEIDLGKVSHASRVEASLDLNDEYLVVYRRSGLDVGSSRVEVGKGKKVGLRIAVVDVPPEVAAGGYDLVAIRPVSGDDKYVLGHFRLLD